MLKPVAVLVALALALPVAPALAAPVLVAGDTSCASVLNFLPRIVRKEQVAAVGSGAHVVLHSICRGEDLFDFGNAGGLRHTIGLNPALAHALARQGWRADDVVGIAIRGNTVDLYVHRF